MAIRVFDKYSPRANAPDTDYPDGSIKNESVPGANDGTPLDQDWGNDWEGFKQSALADGNVTPNGTPDSTSNPQILDAIKASIRNDAPTYTDLVFDSVDEMISGAGKITWSSNTIGTKISITGGKWKQTSFNSPMTIADFTPLNGVWVDDFITDRSVDVTDKFNEAIALNRKIKLTAGDYLVNNVDAINDMEIDGPQNAFMVCNANGGSVFLANTDTGQVNRVRLSGFSARCAPGVTGAAFWRQTSKEFYSAYCIFEKIQTYREFEITYDGYFIFGKWLRGRDAFRGSAVAGQTHQFISSIPATFGQLAQTNLCQVKGVNIFRNDNPNGAIDIAYGGAWHISGCDFEELDCRAIRARGISGLTVNNQNWFEDIEADDVILIEASPSPNPKGTIPVIIDGNYVDLLTTSVQFMNQGASSLASITNNAFVRAGATTVLTNRLELREFYGNTKQSVANPSFDSGVVALRTATNLDRTCVNTPNTTNINLLPFGRVNMPATTFTGVGLSSGPSDTTSEIGLDNAVRFRLGGGNNILYYQLPTKMVTALRGKVISLSVMGYGEDATSPGVDIIAGIWNTVPVDSGFVSTRTKEEFNSDKLELGVSSCKYGVDMAETALYVGLYAGGSAPNDFCKLEAIELVLGDHLPDLIAL